MRTIAGLFLALVTLPLFAAITGTVMTSDGEPVAAARVSLYAPELPDAARVRLLSSSPARAPLSFAETDAKGSFSLPSPKQPVVDLQIDANGYAPALWLVGNEDDLGAVTLVKCARRTGIVTGSGKPVPDALVVITFRAPAFASAGAEYLTRTDEQGRYEGPEVKVPFASIVAVHPDFAIETGATHPGPQDMNVKLTPGIVLSGRVIAPDGTTGVPDAAISIDGWPLGTSGDDGSFRIPRAPQKWSWIAARTDTLLGFHAAAQTPRPPVIRMEKTRRISGQVAEAGTESPVAGALVGLMSAFTGVPLWTWTDAKGIYSIAAPPMDYRIFASHPAYGTPGDPIALASGERTPKDVLMTRLARLSGVVVDERKRPIAAALITPEDAGGPGAMRLPSRSSARSGPDGRFSVRVSPDRDVYLRATKKGLPHARSERIKLATGEAKRSVVLTIPTGYAVTGRVLNQEGEPLADVRVETSESPNQGWSGRSSPEMHSDADDTVRTTSDGTFSLRLAEGTYDFRFRREGFAPREVTGQRVAAGVIPAIATRLEPTVEIRGRVTRGGAPVAGLRIFASEGSTTTADDGTFTLSGLAAGTTYLHLTKPGETFRESRNVIAPARDIVIDLPVGVTIRGRVMDKTTRQAVREFEIRISQPRGTNGGSSSSTQRFSTDDGSFVLQQVQTPIVITARAPGRRSPGLTLDSQEGKDVDDVLLELDAGLRVTGRITDERDLPVSDARVEFQPMGPYSGMPPRDTTDATGEYVLDTLDSGTATIRIHHPRYVSAQRTVTLSETERETKLDVRLSAGHRVTGVVVDDSGMPVADANVRASGGGIPVRTTATGAFEIDRLPEGRHRFVASKQGLADGVLEDVDIATAGPLRITLGRGATIHGRVLGIPESDFMHTRVRAHVHGIPHTSSVDAQGNYRMEGLPAGTLTISASVQRPSGASRTTSRDLQIRAGSVQQADIAFDGNASIGGRVRRNGTPHSEAMVSFDPLSRTGTHASVGTDQEGRYTTLALPDGPYRVTVRDRRGGNLFSTKYEVRGSATFDIDYAATSVRGTVVDVATGERLDQITVQFYSRTGGGPVARVSTDAAGVFVVPNLTPGPYVVTAWGTGYALQRFETTVGETARAELELSLPKTEGVTVRTIDGRDGRPIVASARVYETDGRLLLDNASRPPLAEAEQGLHLPLPPGTYLVLFSAPGYAPLRTTIPSPSTQTIRLTPGGAIRVQSRHSVIRRLRFTPSGGFPYVQELRPGLNVIQHLAPGLCKLELLNELRGVAETVEVEVREGQTVDVAI